MIRLGRERKCLDLNQRSTYIWHIDFILVGVFLFKFHPSLQVVKEGAGEQKYGQASIGDQNPIASEKAAHAAL